MRIWAFLIALSVLCSDPVYAQGEREIALGISFDWSTNQDLERIAAELSKNRVMPLPLVFVNGRLKGLAPGIISVPIGEAPTVVEIGLPQLTEQPLFSFKIDAAHMENKVLAVIVSNLLVREIEPEGFYGYGFDVLPNVERKIAVERLGERYYSVSLPSDPYAAVIDYAIELEEDTLGFLPEPFSIPGEIMTEYPPAGFAIAIPAHFSYNRDEHEVVMIAYSPESRWTGPDFETSMFILPRNPKPWVIASNPDGADITFNGYKSGSTTISEMELTDSKIQSLVLVKSDYVDCPFDYNKVAKNSYGKDKFFCELIRAK